MGTAAQTFDSALHAVPHTALPPALRSAAAGAASTSLRGLAPLADHSRSQRVEDALLALIAAGGLARGQRLPTEQGLAQQFAVSRATVREAIARLRADGVLSTKPGRGAVVESTVPMRLSLPQVDTPRALVDLYELRRMIEVETAGLAAERHDAGARQRIEAAFRAMQAAAREGHDAHAADLEFHRAVAAATGNLHLVSMVDFIASQLRALLAEAWAASSRRSGGARPAQNEHRLLLRAIVTRDPQAARDAARAHLDAAQARLMRARLPAPHAGARPSANAGHGPR